MRRRRHPARTARGVTAGLSTAAAFGIVAALAAGDAATGNVAATGVNAEDTATLEVHVDPAAPDAAVTDAVRAWLAGEDSAGGARVVEVDPAESGADARTEAS